MELYPMRIIISAATNGEWMPLFQKINPKFVTPNKKFSVGFHESGVGMLASSVSLMKMVVQETPSLIIQMGIAGSLDPKIPLGKVFVIKDDVIGDIGVTENKQWKDLFDLKLDGANDAPFEKKSLPNDWLNQYNLLKLPTKKGVTINTITTDKKIIERYRTKYKAQIESMEGAALHYIGRDLNIQGSQNPHVRSEFMNTTAGRASSSLRGLVSRAPTLKPPSINTIKRIGVEGGKSNNTINNCRRY